VSDQTDQPGEVTETAAELSPSSWPGAEPRPRWAEIADQPESAAPGPAGPGASPERAHAEVQPATEAGRSRRPTSLREQYVKEPDSVPRRKLAAPAFPSAPTVPGSRVTAPVSEGGEEGNTAQVPPAAEAPPVSKPASLLGRLPTDRLPRDRITMDKLPLDKLSADGLQLDRLRTLTRQRPELGLGLAFAGGLVIATILKRLGRR
jgi:hypothetical protein